MTRWKYEAVTPGNAAAFGSVLGETEEKARETVAGMGLEVVSIKKEFVGGVLGKLVNETSSKDRQRFIEDVADLLGSGFSVVESVRMLEPNLYGTFMRQGLRKAIPGIARDLEAGMTFADALESSGMFAGDVVAIARTGQQTGKLADVLKKYSDIMGENVNFRSQIATEMAYPAALFLSLVFAMVIFFGWLVPKLKDVLVYVEKPLISQIVFAIADFMSWGWWLVLIGIAGVIAGWIAVGKNQNWGVRYKVPVLGKIRRATVLSSLSFQMGACGGAGMTLEASMKLLGEAHAEKFVGRKIEFAGRQIEQGVPVRQVVMDDPFFRGMWVSLVDKAVMTGKIEEMMVRCGMLLQKEAQRRMKLFLSVLPMSMIMLFGGLILVVYLAIMIPVARMGEGLQQSVIPGGM